MDPYYDKVFCYISRNHENKKLECHAFLCSKKSKVSFLNATSGWCSTPLSLLPPPLSLSLSLFQAEAITLTVAQAFNIAFERWQSQKKKKAARQQQQQQKRQEERKQEPANGSSPVTNGGKFAAAEPANDLLGK